LGIIEKRFFENDFFGKINSLVE